MVNQNKNVAYRCLICGSKCNKSDRFCSQKCYIEGMKILNRYNIKKVPRSKQLDGFKYFCAVCGKPILDSKRTIYCNTCAVSTYIEGMHSRRFAKFFGLRKCHDCGKPTPNYRCPNCLKKWKSKNFVIDSDEEKTYSINLKRS